ncbi:unnamed protein product [Orchesella dallaii]|uniref:Uncharacterized protein n=1 Tax=Orchesella dallaii TaxID=48710 RepID=A0ABP1RX21_9HEXA
MTFKLTPKMIWKLQVFSIVLIGVLCFLTGAECKRSACWRYGHVCWGGHGKRSGAPPQIPFANVVDETPDGTNSLPPWSQLGENPVWKLNPKQVPKFPFFFNAPSSNRQTVRFVKKEGSPLRRQQRQLLMKTKSTLPGHLLKSLMKQHERPPMYYEPDDLTKITLDDSLIVPDPSLTPIKTRGLYPVSALKAYSAALKRTSDNVQEVATGGTEEPLQTASNGLDSEDSGSFATFFRERKLSLSPTAVSREDIEKEKEYSNSFPGKERMDTLRAAQFNSPLPLDMFPIVAEQYKSDKSIAPFQSKLYYRLR